MSSRAVDTNVLLRYLTADDPEQSPIAGRLIDQPEENSDDFLVTIPVVCELTWLLRSRRYGFDREAMIIVWAITGVAWMERSLRSVIQVLPSRNDDHGLTGSRLLMPGNGCWARVGSGSRCVPKLLRRWRHSAPEPRTSPTT